MKNGRSNMTFHSDLCNEHVKPIQKMIINGNVVCPRCETEKSNKQLEDQTKQWFNKLQTEDKYNTLADKSILEDKTLMKARFNSYIPTIDEEMNNLKKVKSCVDRLWNGEKLNIILQGPPGSGKSHLAYSVLWQLNETKKYSCLFIAVDAMIRKIKDSFNDKQSKFTEEYFNKLLSSVDFLVLDDLGAETGAINTDKTATDFVQKILYGVTNSRQDKVTILTTNLDGQKLKSMYDSKLVSRLMRNPEFILFKESKDKRISKLPF
jgi:DNA replication protein DnaC